ncbi:hypothetical protein [Paracidovorax konjaci]|uniref:Uncharacterized protein n=1 Tax=Paracidovorax konjaci TaxID=32040 RepID=A0A1I1XQU1_9BURK|nr:hypothetical protein [Paracidovorax konjaci]SFE09707.1 hypothetical protein SAMN04489710_11462 [Paracidovorax konjaci]
MAYDNPEHRRNIRHTVRFKAADDALISVLADRLGMQKATLIESMAIRKAEEELQALCTAPNTAQRSNASISANR